MHTRVVAGFLLIVSVCSARAQITGAQDYGVGGSSVSWFPRSPALFLNPAYLGRLHQGDVYFSTDHFSNLSSLCSSYFVPFVGTFAVGMGNDFSLMEYSLGYGTLLNKDLAVGGAFNVERGGVDYSTFSAGVSAHVLESETMTSGLHVGASAFNVGVVSLMGSSVGVSYWILPGSVRAQAAWLYQAEHSEGVGGAFFQVNDWFSLFAGTVGFKEAAGGFGYRSSYLNAGLALGDRGVSLTLNLRFTDDSRDVRDSYFQRGTKAYDDERYTAAFEYFVSALKYDEYYMPARMYSELATSAKETTIAVSLREGRMSEDQGDYAAAMKMYSRVLKVDPTDDEASTRLHELESKFRSHVSRLIEMGDSLMSEKKFDQARASYQEAADFDPGNTGIEQKVTGLDSMIVDRVQYHTERARNFQAKNQVEEARREYEMILTYDSKNSFALNRLEAFKARKASLDLFDKGKTLFEQKNYFEALTVFLDFVQHEPNNKDAKAYIDRSREILKRDVEQQFKAGLQHYVKENYRAALDIWNKVLIISPGHQATLEYSKRAKEKLEALEKLR